MPISKYTQFTNTQHLHTDFHQVVKHSKTTPQAVFCRIKPSEELPPHQTSATMYKKKKAGTATERQCRD